MENLNIGSHEIIEQKLGIERKNKIRIIPIGENDLILAWKIMETLLSELGGAIIVNIALWEKSLQSNLRHADKGDISIAILVDQKRWGNDVIIKDMRKEDRIQSQIPQNLIIQKIKEWLGITSVEVILSGYKIGALKLETAEFLLDMYYTKGII